MNPSSVALPASQAAPAPYISVVIPVFNEEENWRNFAGACWTP